MVNFKEQLDYAIKQAVDKGYEQSRAEWLMLDLFGWSRTDYLIHMYDDMSKAEEIKFSLATERMLLGEPIQYIVGFQSFYGYQFQVNEHCLIPRPETEEVMLHFLENCKSSATIADIGTGSGVLAVTLKKLNKDFTVYATDIVQETLEVASDNAHYHEVAVTFLKGNALKPFIQNNIKLDGIVSNPPYIDVDEMEMMENTVVKYEPHKALFAENKGFAIYELILNDLPKVLNKDAYVTFEIGYNQGERLKNIILEKYPKLDVKVIKDINGNERIVSFKW
ncbi:peptide chain release factor N(5)-glutamine methyltransferase [Staphylococcus haemolyticus]|uniref:peptide chain release factor N(5)-glutamine methyltransferase n=1 Tax=Staphylococcus haemolyticus TaxID=1283 RepID=UPI00069F7E37|nr:peptide chain release factor N(5)-glutamine methyltransferase [Staphylococcus haemolyticus]MCH4387661.1 peptide chain release factor N(5)-glutamine methyltransferase [Staphylococcus haemolyticus]MCH4432161.1 peptide chain release factor N(5)-glutamine methyltransferase [Staphylococcus haemolyticus]MCH4507175.1 peptide chain release factor N(5)-glutamine methyltransferase [Staphylococcus haemolyticus]MCK6070203.1 peptide chain release factor N(5)-glutamine methyltransferase [Staphylococcus ha